MSKQNDTTYDDVFKTLLNDSSRFILPVINELFGEHYKGDEKIIFGKDEHFLNSRDSNRKVITDSIFTVIGETTKMYHLECQSTADNSMLVRFFEYDSQIALDEGEIVDNVLTLNFPHSAVLFLRHTGNTPDFMTVKMVTPSGTISYEIPVMKVKNYSIEDIFDKNLLFLIPFYIFTHEKSFELYENNPDELKKFIGIYTNIKERLEIMSESSEIDEYERRILYALSNRVAKKLANNFNKVKKAVNKVMGGKILDYEAKRILNRGRVEGRAEGRSEGRDEGRAEGLNESRNNIAVNMLRDNLPFNQIMKYTNISESELRSLAKKLAIL